MLCARLRDAWSFTKYTKKLTELSELQELLTTPFMLEIIVQILPALSGRSASLEAIKVLPSAHSRRTHRYPPPYDDALCRLTSCC